MPEPEGNAEPCCTLLGPLSMLFSLRTVRLYRSGDGFTKLGELNDDVDVEVGIDKSNEGTLLKSRDNVLLRVGSEGACCCF